MARKSVKAAVEEVKATAENTEVLTEEPKKAVKKTTVRKTAAKKTAEETAEEAVPAEKAEAQAEQEAASVKKTAAKKTTVRKTAAKKETKEPNVSVTFEYANKQIVAKELLAKAMEVFCAAHAEVEIQDMQLYVNADEGCAYIVVNGVEYPEDRILF